MADSAAGDGDEDLARLTGWDRAAHGSDRATYVVDATAQVLRAAAGVPERVEVSGETVLIDPFAWRDFQPGDGMSADGSPLMVGIRVKGTKHGRFPPLLRPEWVAVINGDRVWITYGVIEHLTAGDKDQYTVMARHGPRWGPGILVHVLLQLRDQGDRTYRVRSNGVRIERTD